MDFRLRVFVEVAENLSFTKASNALAISQPAITKHIQELENTYNVKLFHRSAGKIQLTAAGSVFLEYAQDILGRYRLLSDEMALYNGADITNPHTMFGDEISIAATPRATPFILPLLGGFTSRYPQVKIIFSTMSEEEIESALHSAELHFGFVHKSALSGPNAALLQIGECSLFASGNAPEKAGRFLLYAGIWVQKSKDNCSQ